ncbi:MAG TPA: methyl-accepting chemotaxis protein [Gammaproteobacteria bacterium]
MLFRHCKVGTRIQLAFTAVFVIAVGAIVAVGQSYTEGVIAEAEQRELHSHHNNMVAMIEQQGLMAEALAETLANMPVVQQAFAAGDRAALHAAVKDAFAVLKKDYGVMQQQFHTAPALSFLRVHKPEQYGDDLSGFRNTVVDVNRSRSRIRGIEQGVAGLGIRGVVPVFLDGRHLGSLEFGLSFGEAFLEQFAGRYGLKVGLQLIDGTAFKPLAKAFSGVTLLNPEELSAALKGATLMRTHTQDGIAYAVYAAAVKDYSGQPFGVVELAMDRTHYAEQLSEARTAMFGTAALTLVAGLLLFALLAANIVKPLRLAVHSMEEIAGGQGDLTRRLPVEGRDELAQLADSFNRFVARIQDTVRHVMESSTKVSGSAEGMMEITLMTSEGVQRQRSEIESVATAMNEMTATVQEVARNAALAAAAATEANGQAQTGRGVVEDSIREIRRLADDIGATAEIIHRLSNDSESIGGVVDVIRGIAEQTNLLALNAAIEAARAGEQGRGFAVVADEVRTLAQRTQHSTREIQAMIERLQSGAREAVAAMEKGREQTESTVQQASGAGAVLHAITRSVGSISDMNTQIATAAEEQSAVAEEINRNIATINGVADQTADGAAQTATASEDLADLATGLQTIVARFRV